MAILVEGIDMPNHDNEYVIFTVYGDGGVVYGPLNRPHVRSQNRTVPVPEPHGRLIDARLLKETLDYYIREAGWSDEINKALNWVKDEFINSEPTVIPANPAEEG